MKKIHKIFITLALSVGLLCGAEQKECEATGIPTVDITNLLQNVLGFIQDADLAGMFDQISDYDMKFKAWFEKAEQLRKFLEFWKVAQQGAKYGREIARLADFYLDEVDFMSRATQYFISQGATPEITMSALTCINDFKALWKILSEDTTEKSKLIDSFKKDSSGNIDTIAILEATEKMLESFKKDFYELDVHYRSEMSRLYYKHRQIQYALEDGRFLSQKFYY